MLTKCNRIAANGKWNVTESLNKKKTPKKEYWWKCEERRDYCKSPAATWSAKSRFSTFFVSFLFTFVTLLLDYFEQTNFAIYLFFVFLICASILQGEIPIAQSSASFFATSTRGKTQGNLHLQLCERRRFLFYQARKLISQTLCSCRAFFFVKLQYCVRTIVKK